MVGEEAEGEAEEESAMMERIQPVLTDQRQCSMVTGLDIILITTSNC